MDVFKHNIAKGSRDMILSEETKQTYGPTLDEDEGDRLFCTFPVTGDQPSFQAIFVCNDCICQHDTTSITTPGNGKATTAENQNDSNQEQQTERSPLCICQACADFCHEEEFHQVDYIGMGPATCDCNHLGGCKLYELSVVEAKRLGIVLSRNDVSDEDSSMIPDVYNVEMLNDASTSHRLVRHAQELIRHTKETHWVDHALINSGEIVLTALELFAWKIYQHHRTHYKKILGNQNKNGDGGVEWWVQVKPIKELSAEFSGIDLHYDKDEALAESFGLGSFPTLSTVTYLTGASANSPPTIVLDHMYTQCEDEVMSQMLVSRPRLGKHLVFDGRLLHGAPFHSKLQPLEADGSEEDHFETVNIFRVTFLVNVWKDRRPSNVQVLDNGIRQILLDLEGESSNYITSEPIKMTTSPIARATIDNENQLPESLRERIELPFVPENSEMECFDNECGGSVVVTFPPPPLSDTMLITFGPGMQAYLDSVENEQESTIANGLVSEGGSDRPTQQSDYV